VKIIFAGTPDFAASSLRALLETDHDVIAVYTQPDRPAGRGRKLTASPVKELALEHNIPVHQPVSLKGEAEQAELAALGADLMVVVAYGLLLPKAVLDTPAKGCINVHGSLLPRWRGAAPIHRAVLAGDTETGITIMQMDVGLDTGDMLYKVSCPINDTDTSGELHDRLALLGAGALVDTLALMDAETLTPEPQDDALANYAHKLEKQEGQIDWSQPAFLVDRQIRGLSPWPGTFTQLGDDTLRVHASSLSDSSSTDAPGTVLDASGDVITVACGEGTALNLTRVQLPGGKAMDTKALLNARRALFEGGVKLGS
jgi:methionyl-tRNA formyltransferase